MSSSVEPFVALAKGTRGAATAAVIAQALSAPDVFFFYELLQVPSVRDVRCPLAPIPGLTPSSALTPRPRTSPVARHGPAERTGSAQDLLLRHVGGVRRYASAGRARILLSRALTFASPSPAHSRTRRPSAAQRRARDKAQAADCCLAGRGRTRTSRASPSLASCCLHALTFPLSPPCRRSPMRFSRRSSD